jgi:hypothetical protein
MFLQIIKPIILETGILLICHAACATPVPSPPAPRMADILSVAALQTALGRNGFGAGFVDGKDGPRTYHAFRDYRRATGLSDRRAREALLSNNIPVTLTYTITQNGCTDTQQVQVFLGTNPGGGISTNPNTNIQMVKTSLILRPKALPSNASRGPISARYWLDWLCSAAFGSTGFGSIA